MWTKERLILPAIVVLLLAMYGGMVMMYEMYDALTDDARASAPRRWQPGYSRPSTSDPPLSMDETERRLLELEEYVCELQGGHWVSGFRSGWCSR